MARLEAPVETEEELWIDIKSNKPQQGERWLVRQIIAQQATGAVRLRSADKATEDIIELADYEWRWRSMPLASGAQGQMAVFGKYDPLKRDRNSPFAHPALGDTVGWY